MVCVHGSGSRIRGQVGKLDTVEEWEGRDRISAEINARKNQESKRILTRCMKGKQVKERDKIKRIHE
jgi:hypothetical protein